MLRQGVCQMHSVSASQIETFDVETPFGCHVKWWLNVHMIPVARTDPSLILGDAVHQTLERYLRGGAQGELHDIVIHAPGAVPWLEKLRPRVKLVEHWICEVEKVERDGQLVEKPKSGGWSDLYLAGVPVHGKLDWAATPAEDHGALFRPQIELGDHKTSSNISRYGKTAGQVKHSPQMNIYAAAMMGNELIEQLFGEDPESFIFTQDFYQTGKRGKKFDPVSVSVLKPEIDKRILEIEATVEQMKLVEQKAKPDDVEPDTNKCDIGFGCPHRAYCPHYGAFNMDSLLDAFAVPATPAQEIVPTSSASQLSVAMDVPAPKVRKLAVTDVVEDGSAAVIAEPADTEPPALLPLDAAPRAHVQTPASALVDAKPVKGSDKPIAASAAAQPAARRGRPPGSKNKPKAPDATQIAQQVTAAAQSVTTAPVPKAGEEPAKKPAVDPGPETEAEIVEIPAPSKPAPVAPAETPKGVPGPVQVDRITIRHGARIGMPNFSSATVEVEYSAIVHSGSVDQAKDIVSLACRKAMHDELEVYVKK